MKTKTIISLVMTACLLGLVLSDSARAAETLREGIYQVGALKPRDSILKVKVGDKAPGFSLKSVSGGMVSLKDFLHTKNVVISFVPAAWTPVCSDQWPGYNIVREEFDSRDAMLIGITVDNIPTLYAWTKAMGTLWFPVLSDFWPHGKVADTYGVLRSDGTSERTVIIIDKQGIIRYIDVHDINRRPPLEDIIRELEKLEK
jgi:peroxiredoxin (alkyl hydroperoxide reductase subunit C)